MAQWLIYGANGYTGQLMAAEAVRRGLKPILAGRNARAIGALGLNHGLPVRTFGLNAADEIRAGLENVCLVLNCAGPFSATVAPMVEGCLARGAHYLDITGEIEVFAHCHAQDSRARARGSVVLPGTGFDVVPTDCVAGLLKQALPDAIELVLGFEAGGGASPGTTRTGLQGVALGGRVRRRGQLIRVPLAYKTRTFSHDGQQRTAMTIPWGDLYTAFVSTGIPDIETYMAVSPKGIATARRANWLRPLLGIRPVVRLLERRVAARVKGPSDETRARTRARIWGEASNDRGEQRYVEIDTPNGYDLTVTAALGIVQHLLTSRVPGGYVTPAMLMGSEYVLTLPGVRRIR